MPTTGKHLKTLIANGKTEQAISQLMALSTTLDKDLQEEILMQSAKYKTYQKDKRQGTIHNQELQITLNRINTALLEIIHQLPDANPGASKNITRKLLKWAGGAAAIIAFLAAAAELSGYSLRDLFTPDKDKTEINDQEQQVQERDTERSPATEAKDESEPNSTESKQPPKNTATTSGKNSPAIVNTGDNSDVNINYGNVDPFEESDTNKVKKDSSVQKNQ